MINPWEAVSWVAAGATAVVIIIVTVAIVIAALKPNKTGRKDILSRR